MSRSVDNYVRRAVTEVVGTAPLAPRYADLEARVRANHREQGRLRPRRPRRMAAAVVSAATLAGVASYFLSNSSNPARVGPAALPAGPDPIGTASVPSQTAESLDPVVTSTQSSTPVETGLRCNYTDPAMSTISVARALTCADGTTVWVEGSFFDDGFGGGWLCDPEHDSSVTSCAEAGLRIVGDVRELENGFLGTIFGRELRPTTPPPSKADPDPPPTSATPSQRIEPSTPSEIDEWMGAFPIKPGDRVGTLGK